MKYSDKTLITKYISQYIVEYQTHSPACTGDTRLAAVREKNIGVAYVLCILIFGTIHSYNSSASIRPATELRDRV